MVDDDPMVRGAYAKLLLRDKHDVVIASTVAEATALARNGIFDLCITDIALPDASGADLIRDLRGNPSTASLPIIVLSGFAAEHQHEIIALKPHSIYQKPVAIEDLRWAIQDAGRAPSPWPHRSLPRAPKNRTAFVGYGTRFFSRIPAPMD